MNRLQSKNRCRWMISLAMMVMLLGLSACGSQQADSDAQVQGPILVLETEAEECILLEEELGGVLMSSQFYQGEVIQFWKVSNEGESQKRGLDIYLCRGDGSSELIFENVATAFSGNWFLDSEGNYIILQSNAVTKVDKAGNAFYRKEIAGGYFSDICQLSDGRIFLLETTDEGVKKLLSMDSATGEISAMDYVSLGEDYSQGISTGEEGLLWLNAEGIWSIDIETGAKTKQMDFVEYEYAPDNTVADFRVMGETEAEILHSGEKESLKVTDIGATRTIITAKCRQFYDEQFMKECIALFNRSNDTYYVIADTVDEGEDHVTFVTQTGIEIGTGGGSDLIFYDAVSSPESLAEKGAFEDLRPYMEASGLKEEDFFSAAFGFMQVDDAIYAASVMARPTGLWISEELLGSRQAPDIETLVNALLSYEEQAIFQTAWESDQVLEYFLTGSENLWGMVDWEEGICDFSGELFAKMLEAAKRYGFDRTKELPYVAYPMKMTFYQYETLEQMESEGKVPVGFIFEDGCYQIINQSGVMFINSNSDDAHKQGAWEFISFLLSEEIQDGVTPFSVNKNAFETVAAREIEEGSLVLKVGADGKTTKVTKTGTLKDYNYDEEAYKAANDLTEEKVSEIRTLLETSRALPTRNVPVIAIINEEAAAYFSGAKSIEEVVAVIENRVELYLKENK